MFISMNISAHDNNTTYLTWTPTIERIDGNIDIKSMTFSSYVALPNFITVIPNSQTDFIYDIPVKDENNYCNRENSNFIWETSSPENTDNVNNYNNSFILDLSIEQDNHDGSNINTSCISKINMQMSNDNDKDAYFDCVDESLITIDSSSAIVDRTHYMERYEEVTEHKVSLFILREQEATEEFSIRLLFDSKIKFTFNIDEELGKKNSHRTLVYRVDLQVKRNKSGELSVLDEKRWKKINAYQLYISRSIFFKKTAHYNDHQSRTLYDPLDTTLNFILDVNFQGGPFSNPGGKTFKRFQDTDHSPLRNVAGSNLPWWNRLCLFTYYLIRHHDYTSIKVLVDQFKSLLQSDAHQLTREELNGFFQECSVYFTSLLKDFPDKSELVKHLLCIIGLLPTEGKNRDWSCDHTVNFIKTILQYVLSDSDSLLGSTTHVESSLLVEGFATLLYILFSSEKSVVDRFNKQNTGAFALFCRIPVKDQYRTLADAVLSRFKTFQHTLSSSNWTELMIRVSPDQLIFNILEKTPSIEAYFTCITKTLEICEPVNDFRAKFQASFDERVRHDFESKELYDQNIVISHSFRLI